MLTTYDPIRIENIEGIDAEIYSEISNDFLRRISTAYKALPEPLKLWFENGHNYGGSLLRFRFAQKFSHIERETKLKKSNSDDCRTHIDQSGGCASYGSLITISEFILCSCFNLQAGGDYKVQSDLEETLRHELGHIFDIQNGELSQNYKFAEAWEQDVRNAGGIEALRSNGYGYFIANRVGKYCRKGDPKDEGAAGRSEVFAELWAYYHGEGVNSDIVNIFPSTAKYTFDLLDSFYAFASTDPTYKNVHTNFSRWHCEKLNPNWPNLISDSKAKKTIRETKKKIKAYKSPKLFESFEKCLELIDKGSPIFKTEPLPAGGR